MPDWADDLKKDVETDSLEKIVETIENALLPMMRSMLPGALTTFQWMLLRDEVDEIHKRIESVIEKRIMGGHNGDSDDP